MADEKHGTPTPKLWDQARLNNGGSAQDPQKFSHASRKILRGEQSALSIKNHHGRRSGNTHNSVALHRQNRCTGLTTFAKTAPLRL
eukprot:scaffold27135_cov76-Cyclotella_meneghiniana.AAC.1